MAISILGRARNFLIIIRISINLNVSALMGRLNTLEIINSGIILLASANFISYLDIIVWGIILSFETCVPISEGPVLQLWRLIHENFSFLKNSQIVSPLLNTVTFLDLETALVKQHCFYAGSRIFIWVYWHLFTQIALLIVNIDSSRQMLKTHYLSLMLIRVPTLIVAHKSVVGVHLCSCISNLMNISFRDTLFRKFHS